VPGQTDSYCLSSRQATGLGCYVSQHLANIHLSSQSAGGADDAAANKKLQVRLFQSPAFFSRVCLRRAVLGVRLSERRGWPLAAASGDPEMHFCLDAAIQCLFWSARCSFVPPKRQTSSHSGVCFRRNRWKRFLVESDSLVATRYSSVVCLSSVTLVHPAKAVGRNKMPFERYTWVVPSNIVFDRASARQEQERFEGSLPPVCSDVA